VEFEIKRSSTTTLSAVAGAFIQMDQEATEMEKCDEEISIGYRWFNSIGHSRSRVGR
jgi:hypothetical protein